MSRFVLDTSALLALKQDEPGAAAVDKIMLKHGTKNNVWICFVTRMEFYYILQRRYGEDAMRNNYLVFKELPLKVLESDEELGLLAAKIKATARLSLGDAWVAAAAQRLGATLVHKDPEFEQLKGIIKLQPLPYK